MQMLVKTVQMYKKRNLHSFLILLFVFGSINLSSGRQLLQLRLSLFLNCKQKLFVILRMANRISSNDRNDKSTNSLLIVSAKCKASSNRSRVLISPSKQLLYFFHKSDTFNMKSLQTLQRKTKIEPKLRIISSKQKNKENLQVKIKGQKQVKVKGQEISFYQKYKRQKSKSKQQKKKHSQSLQKKGFKYQSLNSSKIDKSSEEYFKQLRNQVGQIRKKYSKNELFNKENKRLSTTDSCNSGASLIIQRESNNTRTKQNLNNQNNYLSHLITPIKKVGFKKPMSSAFSGFKNDKKQKLKLIYNSKEKALNFDRKESRETQAQELDQPKLTNQLQNTKLFQFTFGNMALMDYPHSMINSVQC